ncbi:MAG TPA: polyphosphate kinase 2 [Burkholderiales bacterium]|nr:polyphosphate kinase 2 [Burkholderiales bacterium]
MKKTDTAYPSKPKLKVYKQELHNLQIELVKLQKHIISNQLRIVVIFEGRDAAGKDGTIKRITEHLSPRETRVVALGKPNDHDESSWYFQRYVRYLPSAQEMVLFNRSWYNRAGVERVMGFCSSSQYEEFMTMVPVFEQMLVHDGIQLFKYYLDISQKEQEERLKSRRTDPLTQWKTSPIDAVALRHWNDYSLARNEMFARSHSTLAPWTVVRANIKELARLNVIRDLLSRTEYKGKTPGHILPDPAIVFPYQDKALKSGLIEP